MRAFAIVRRGAVRQRRQARGLSRCVIRLIARRPCPPRRVLSKITTSRWPVCTIQSCQLDQFALQAEQLAKIALARIARLPVRTRPSPSRGMRSSTSISSSSSYASTRSSSKRPLPRGPATWRRIPGQRLLHRDSPRLRAAQVRQRADESIIEARGVSRVTCCATNPRRSRCRFYRSRFAKLS